ncbi:MAG: 16S rRNA (guanine(527)-N(7))-methyltransferase RsmG, partial [Candidatus Binatia bacterium]
MVAAGDPWGELVEQARELFALDLSDEQVSQLRSYVSVLEVWSARLNLVSARSTVEIVRRHVLDSLAPADWLGPGDVFADIGSGAGFPGIPLAVIGRGTVRLLESRVRRASFLRQVIRTLGLPNASVHAGRAEDFRDERLDAVVARGIEERALAGLAARLLPAEGRLIAMRTARQ